LLQIELQKGSEVIFELFDFFGRIVIEQQYSNSDITLDISAVPSGVYLLRINVLNKQDIVVKKIIIQ